MRVFVLIVIASLIATLGGLGVASSRAVSTAGALTAPAEIPPGYWP